MNYIKLLIAAHQKIINDERLNSTHVSLYFSLFQEWNSCHFSESFFINRQDLMQASKIGSKATYLKCLKDLDTWGYLYYIPSYNSYKGSTIRMKILCVSERESETEDPVLEELAEAFSKTRYEAGINFIPVVNREQTGNEPAVNRNSTGSEQALVPSINNNKQANNNKLPNDRQAVLNFFSANGADTQEAEKFLKFYKGNNWKTNDGVPIRDWQAVALSWMERSYKKAPRHNEQFNDHLKIRKEKNYEQPL